MRSALAAVRLILLKRVSAHSPVSCRQNDISKSIKYQLGTKQHTSKDENFLVLAAAENLKN